LSSTVNVMERLPRFSRSTQAARTNPSSVSRPAGNRQRTSRLRPLTHFSSQAHRRSSSDPWRRANPVMLAMVTLILLGV